MQLPTILCFNIYTHNIMLWKHWVLYGRYSYCDLISILCNDWYMFFNCCIGCICL